MDIADLERIAMRNDPMPDNLSFQDQVLYQGLRYLYRQFKSGTITREQGAKEKKALLLEHSKIAQEVNYITQYSKYYANVYSALGQSATAYAKERTLEHADALYEALYHVPPVQKGK